MAEVGSNRGSQVTSDTQQGQGASQEIQHGGPTFDVPSSEGGGGRQESGGQQGGQPDYSTTNYWGADQGGNASYDMESAADAAARAAAAAKARAEAAASAQRQENDRNIAKAAREAQAERTIPQARQAATTQVAPAPNVSELQKKVTEEDIRMAPTGEVHDAQGRFVDPETSRRVRENVNELVMEDGNDFDYEYDNGQLMSVRRKQPSGRRQTILSAGQTTPQNVPDNVTVTEDGTMVNENGEVLGNIVDHATKGMVPQPARKREEPQRSQEQERELTMREQIDELARDLFYSRNRQARNKNKSLYRQMVQGEIDQDEYESRLDQEAFQDTLKPINRSRYRTNAEYEAARALRKEGQAGDIEESGRQSGVGTKVKDTYKLDRLLDQTVWDMRVGFFHVQSERINEDEKTGAKSFVWSRRVEDAMNTLMEDFDGTGIDGQRTVFRMVRLYATMAIDRQGKMFNQDQDEWSLTQDEFIDICNCMHRSIVMYGHPFVAPAFLQSSVAARTSLRGTDMFPSGVIPRVVAEAICGEDSAIRFPKGHPREGEPMTADDLIDVCHKEWVNRTQPLMNANLVNRKQYKPRKNKDGEEIKERNLVAQRIAIENAMQAFARLDGMDASAFGSKFNIDTAQHYKLAEYQDNCVEYASVTNGKYDSGAVNDRMLKKSQIDQQKRSKRKRHKVSTFEASANLMTSGIKTNALWWNLPVIGSGIMEHGVGNLQTYLTLEALRGQYANADRYQIDQQITDAFRTSEGYAAIDAAYLLLEIGGPSALRDFALSGAPMNQSEAIKWLQENVLREAGSERAAQIQEANIKLNKMAQNILAGNTAFRKSDVTNFFNALMISNQAIADTQEQLAARGDIDTYAGLSLTGAEMLDVFKANNGDVSRFLTEVMTTAAGKDALMMMKSNNIAQFNVVSHGVNSWLRDHGIGNAAITAFLDSFATYGVNFLYAMIPGSRTFTYLSLKQYENDYDITAADFAMGGGLGVRDKRFSFKEDPGFYNGLKMNIMFDAMTMGKWALGGILIGGVLAALGFEPPDDPEDTLNVSKWKIGKNVGLGPDTDSDGKGNGIEIQTAYWLNDLTQWGLPNAYAIAAAITIPAYGEVNGKSRQEIIEGLFTDSMMDQFDGNVVLDITDCILNWGDDKTDIERAINDPTYEMQQSPFFAMTELGLRAFGKIVPGAPLYRAWGTSAALRGPDARMFSTNKTFDKSSDWAQSVGKTDYIDDPGERLIRKYSAGNWLLAAFMDAKNALSPNADQLTGYAWWEMPIRTKTEPFALALAEEQKIDYDHLKKGETKESYNAKRTDDLKAMIKDRGYKNPEEAIRDGFFITHDMRMAALDTMFSELNALENEFNTKCDEQAFDYKSDYYDALEAKKAKTNEIWDFINDWLKNDDIPTWMENYEQLLSDWDVTYVKADGTPATQLDLMADRLFNQGQGIEEKWKLKGNMPTSMLPFTTVQYASNDIVQRGASGETVPYWVNKDSNLTSYSNIEALGDKVISVGRDAGSTVNDVYFGEEYDGKRWHEGDITVGERAWVPKKQPLPEDIKNFGKDSASGGIYGDLGKSADSKSTNGGNGGEGNKTTSGNNTDDSSQKPWKEDYNPNAKLPWKYSTSFYPRSSYGGGGGGGGGGGYSRSSGSYDYNPKIYSNPRNVNADRAATMYSKTPHSARTTSYLRPGFSTKGSREAYKRQDF